jgi:cytochrome b
MSHIGYVVLAIVIVLLLCWGPWTLALLRARKLDRRYTEAVRQQLRNGNAEAKAVLERRLCKCDEQNGSSLCPIHRSGE